MHAWYPQRPEEGARSSRAVYAGNLTELSAAAWALNHPAISSATLSTAYTAERVTSCPTLQAFVFFFFLDCLMSPLLFKEFSQIKDSWWKEVFFVLFCFPF